MSSLRRTLRFVSAGVLAVAIAPILTHAELSSTSPFLPPQSQVVAAPTAPPPLELRGINVLENVTLFSIFDATAKKPAGWLKLNEAGPGFTIKSFDAASDTVTVDFQGKTLKLPMRTPKTAVSAGPVVAASPVPVPLPLQNAVAAAAPRPLVASGTPVAANPPPTTAADAAKLKEWTDEIERRRNVRNQPAGTPATPAIGPITIPQAAPGPQPMDRAVNSTGPVPSNSPARGGQ